MRRMNALSKSMVTLQSWMVIHELQGAEVYATDFKSSSSVSLAGLKANGITRVRNLKISRSWLL